MIAGPDSFSPSPDGPLFSQTLPLTECDGPPMQLSVVMPIYNQRATLQQVARPSAGGAPWKSSLYAWMMVSRDGSREILAELQREHRKLRAIPPRMAERSLASSA